MGPTGGVAYLDLSPCHLDATARSTANSDEDGGVQAVLETTGERAEDGVERRLSFGGETLGGPWGSQHTVSRSVVYLICIRHHFIRGFSTHPLSSPHRLQFLVA